MKKIKGILSLLLALSMVFTATACNKQEEAAKDTEEVTLTTDEAEQVVEDFLDILVEMDIEDKEADDYVTENASKDMTDAFDKYRKKGNKIFAGGEDDEEMSDDEFDTFKDVMEFDYEIESSEEKDGKVIVKAELTNVDYSFLKDLISYTNEEAIAYLQNAVDNGLITVTEANTFLQTDDMDYSIKIFKKLSGGETVSATVEFTVIKEGDKVRIDEFDDAKDLVAVLHFNMMGTL